MKKLAVLISGGVFALACAAAATAADTIKIGVLMPLSGNSGNAGKSAVAAIELGADIINSPHAGLASLPLGAGKGLPKLGGAKIQLVIADTQGNPTEGQNQALRLITQEHVTAIVGTYHSNVSFTATAVAERYGIPYVVGDSVAANITGRGFKWVFRTTPIASDFANNYMEFLNDLKKQGHPVATLAIVYENTDYGTSVSGTVRDAAKAHGINLLASIPYNANGADVSPQVIQLKEKNPDAIIFISYTADSILYMKTMKNLDYMPKVVIGDDSGFSDPAFMGVADLSQGAINRSAWDVGKPGSVTSIINDLYTKKTGHGMDDTSGRDMQAFFVLADAIDRAGSTKPEAIQKALRETNLKPEQLMMGFKGVKFDATGQNTLAATYLIQLFGKDYVAIWPENKAQRKLVYPFKGWK